MDFDVTIINDEVAEETEYFEVHFYVDAQANSGGYAFPSSIVRVTILDDDGGMFNWNKYSFLHFSWLF